LLKCSGCHRDFRTKNSVRAHWAFCSRKNSNVLTLGDVPWQEATTGMKRKMLLEAANFSCTSCGFNKTRACGRSILEIDHIDGNPNNNTRENLRVLCPNCHALTPNFRNWGRKGKNKTSSRIRASNAGYTDAQLVKDEERKTRTDAYNERFVDLVRQAAEQSVIQFDVWGWGIKLNSYLNKEMKTSFTSQMTTKRLQRLMPDFYDSHCYKRI
jgi:hypothetical protein